MGRPYGRAMPVKEKQIVVAGALEVCLWVTTFAFAWWLPIRQVRWRTAVSRSSTKPKGNRAGRGARLGILSHRIQQLVGLLSQIHQRLGVLLGVFLWIVLGADRGLNAVEHVGESDGLDAIRAILVFLLLLK